MFPYTNMPNINVGLCIVIYNNTYEKWSCVFRIAQYFDIFLGCKFTPWQSSVPDIRHFFSNIHQQCKVSDIFCITCAYISKSTFNNDRELWHQIKGAIKVHGKICFYYIPHGVLEIWHWIPKKIKISLSSNLPNYPDKLPNYFDNVH